ncbi:probable LRR receptor-like serine/threonine-protein kinase At3g47570 [Rhododendron vialii]|uniref:probable LRR receptor-like serine/threonine-protein kinase At3g47570 n=1 Tax=Rhododendron vialii TaxID=182163 RepID=UPI00265D7253|nr:probable LRR receptor-like serine/threonine-protein kinase At3g47570 [Rhododendron vialii]
MVKSPQNSATCEACKNYRCLIIQFMVKFPPISSCPNLVGLEFSGNRLTREIPVELGSLSKLEGLYIGKNNLAGGLPSTLGNLSSLEIIYANVNKIGVPHNQIEGSIPSNLGINLPNLRRFVISNNMFTGSIPITLSNATKLDYLGLAANGFKGKVPSLEKLKKLEVLILQMNHLGTGEVDDLSFLNTLTNAPRFSTVSLAFNSFGSMLPESISNLSTELYSFSLGFNNSLAMSVNQLSGNIPFDIGKLQKLKNYNNLSGSIPREIGLLRNLEVLDVSKNMLVGNIPSSLGCCVMLFSLNMEGNKLWRILPSSLATLRGMEELDLSHNNLSGKIPDYLDGFVFLKKLNLLFNDFEGAVPKRSVFKNASAFYVEGDTHTRLLDLGCSNPPICNYTDVQPLESIEVAPPWLDLATTSYMMINQFSKLDLQFCNNVIDY